MAILRRDTAKRLLNAAQQVERRQELQPLPTRAPRGGGVNQWFFGVVGKVLTEEYIEPKVHRCDVWLHGGPFPECDEEGWIKARIDLGHIGMMFNYYRGGEIPLPGTQIFCLWDDFTKEWVIVDAWPPDVRLEEPLTVSPSSCARATAEGYYCENPQQGSDHHSYSVTICGGGPIITSRRCRWDSQIGWHIPQGEYVTDELYPLGHVHLPTNEKFFYYRGSIGHRSPPVAYPRHHIVRIGSYWWDNQKYTISVDGENIFGLARQSRLPFHEELWPKKYDPDNWAPVLFDSTKPDVILVPTQQGGVTRSIYIGSTHLEVFEGHVIRFGVIEPGLIGVGGELVPEDAVGRFFPWPGLWNGMPQWRHGQNPNWWIRWVPLPNNPQQGRWVIGWWPNDAQQGQQPQRGWGQQPPAEGQPPNLNPIDEFPDPIGDVQGTPQTITADYLIQDCIHTQSYVELVNSGQFVWPVGQVIKWADAEGNVHCGKVADLPVEGTKVQNWRLISLEKSCQACGVDVVVADCNLPQKKYRLQGSGSLGLQPGQVIVWVENPGGGVWEELHCGTVQARSDIFTHDASPEAWAFGKIISSCQQCPSGECPSEPSCPSYPSNPPCPEYCPCIEVIGQIQPAEALGVYTLQGVWNEHCWWKKDNWAVYYVPATTKWYIVNLQNSQQYWWRHGNGPFGGYRPRDTGETTGIAVIVGK